MRAAMSGSRVNGVESFMRPEAVTYATGTSCALRGQPFTRSAASAFFVGLLFCAVLSAYVGPFVFHDDTVASGYVAILGEDDVSGRSGSQGQPGADEVGDDSGPVPQPFGAWRETSLFEREPAPARFEFRGDPLTPQSLERPPPGR